MSVIDITKECADEVMLLAKRADVKRSSEISGLGLARRVGDSRIIIHRVWPVLHEDHGSGHVDISADVVNAESAKYLKMQLAAKAAKEAGREFEPENLTIHDELRVWWHSHPGQLRVFSGQDDKTMASLSYLQGDWVVGLLVGQDWVKAQLYLYQPFRIWTTLTEPTIITKQTDEGAVARADKLVEECLPVKVKKNDSVMDDVDKWNKWRYGKGDVAGEKLGGVSIDRTVWDFHCNHYKCMSPPTIMSKFGGQFCDPCGFNVVKLQKNEILVHRSAKGARKGKKGGSKDDTPTLPVGMI